MQHNLKNTFMSFAVIQTGGKQYKVKAGEILKIEKFPEGKPNSKIAVSYTHLTLPTNREV